MSCWVQPGGRFPDGAAEADGEGAGSMDMVAAALAVAAAAVDPALGAGLPAASAGPNVQACPAAGAQAARPAAATRPPPVSAALRRNLRRERSTASSRSVVGRWSCEVVSIARWWRLASSAGGDIRPEFDGPNGVRGGGADRVIPILPA